MLNGDHVAQNILDRSILELHPNILSRLKSKWLLTDLDDTLVSYGAYNKSTNEMLASSKHCIHATIGYICDDLGDYSLQSVWFSPNHCYLYKE